MSDAEKATQVIQKFEKEVVDVVDQVGYFHANMGTLDQVYGVGNFDQLNVFCDDAGLTWKSTGHFQVKITKAEPENW